MEIWQEIITTIIASIVGGGGIAWVCLRLYVKDVASDVSDSKIEVSENKMKEGLKNYTTKEDMQLERKELLEEVERRFLEKVAFEQFTKRFDDKFEIMAKTLDKVVENQEHIKDYIIRRGEV